MFGLGVHTFPSRFIYRMPRLGNSDTPTVVKANQNKAISASKEIWYYSWEKPVSKNKFTPERIDLRNWRRYRSPWLAPAFVRPVVHWFCLLFVYWCVFTFISSLAVQSFIRLLLRLFSGTSPDKLSCPKSHVRNGLPLVLMSRSFNMFSR